MDINATAVPFDLSPGQAGAYLWHLKRNLAALEARAEAIEGQVSAMIRRGERVPLFTLEPSTGREVWTAQFETVVALGDMLGLKLRKPSELITPAQARKAGLTPAIVDSMSTRPPGKTKLVQIDDKAARKAFSS